MTQCQAKSCYNQPTINIPEYCGYHIGMADKCYYCQAEPYQNCRTTKGKPTLMHAHRGFRSV